MYVYALMFCLGLWQEYARADDRGSRRSERIEPRAAAPPPAAPAPAPSVSRGGAASGTFSRGGAARGGRGGRS